MNVPRSVGAAVIMAAILGIMIALVNFMSEPAQKWFAAAPHTFRLIERKIGRSSNSWRASASCEIPPETLGAAPQPAQTSRLPRPPIGPARELAGACCWMAHATWCCRA